MKLLMPIKAKKEVKFDQSLITLAIAAILVAIATFFATPRVAQLVPPTAEFLVAFPATAAIVAWLAVFFGGLFYSWLLVLTLQTLGGKGEFVHGLATIAYSALPISIGILLKVLLIYIPFIGIVLSFIAIAVFGVIGYALVFRLIKLLFETDLIVAFVAVSILAGVTALATYATLTGFAPGLARLAVLSWPT